MPLPREGAGSGFRKKTAGTEVPTGCVFRKNERTENPPGDWKVIF
ncbi:MAG: hypothetical protein ACOCYO_11530 [Bacteroidota bacterium]